MKKKRKTHSPEYKAKVVWEALKEKSTLEALSDKFGLHPVLISKWKGLVKKNVHRVFKADEPPSFPEQKELDELRIGVAWLRERCTQTVEEKKKLIDTDHPELSISAQCKLLGIPRSSFYYRAAPEKVENVLIASLIEEKQRDGFRLGNPKMTSYLQGLGIKINKKRVRRLMKVSEAQSGKDPSKV